MHKRPTPTDPSREAARALLFALPYVGAISAEAARRARALSPERMRVLWALALAPKRGHELAGELRVSRAAVGETALALEKAGLVRRKGDPEDRRAVVFHLTPKGTRAVARFDTAVTDAVAAVVSELPERTQRALATSLSALHALASGRPTGAEVP